MDTLSFVFHLLLFVRPFRNWMGMVYCYWTGRQAVAVAMFWMLLAYFYLLHSYKNSGTLMWNAVYYRMFSWSIFFWNSYVNTALNVDIKRGFLFYLIKSQSRKDAAIKSGVGIGTTFDSIALNEHSAKMPELKLKWLLK